MEQDITPQFGNSCGKLYDDKVIVNASGRQLEVSLKNMRNITFITRPTFKALLFILMPLGLFFFPLLHDEDHVITVILCALAMLFLVLAITNMERSYALLLSFKDGASKKIAIWEGNRMEAKKFAGVVAASLKKKD